jgi:hypothetical protein
VAAGGAALDVFLDTYNLLNMSNEVEEYVVTGRASAKPPRCSRRVRSTSAPASRFDLCRIALVPPKRLREGGSSDWHRQR